jgi:S1-C subfamily serine protease
MLYATAEDEGRSGVKVLDVIPGSPAAHAGFVGVRTPVPETRTEQAMKVAIVALAMSPAAVAVIPLALAHQMFLTCHSPGDVISAVGDQMVRNAQEFSQELRRYRPGDSVAFSLMRCGKPLQITAVMEEEPDDFSSGEVEQDRAHPERFPQGGRGSGPTFNVNFGR